MTIIGIGLDAVERHRVSHRIASKVLSATEYSYYMHCSDNRKNEYLSGRFAGKEAVLKALGIGIFDLDLAKIDIQSDKKGKPFVVLPKEILDEQQQSIHISITHTTMQAMAYVVIEQKE